MATFQSQPMCPGVFSVSEAYSQAILMSNAAKRFQATELGTIDHNAFSKKWFKTTEKADEEWTLNEQRHICYKDSLMQHSY